MARHKLPPIVLPFGIEIYPILIDGAGCHWEKHGEEWKCVPTKGSDCASTDWLTDGCTPSTRVRIVGTKIFLFSRCLCARDDEDVEWLDPWRHPGVDE